MKFSDNAQAKNGKRNPNSHKSKKIQKGRRKNEDFTNKKIEKMVLGERLGPSRVLRKIEQK